MMGIGLLALTANVVCMACWPSIATAARGAF
jgi:hypothetical protein